MGFRKMEWAWASSVGRERIVLVRVDSWWDEEDKEGGGEKVVVFWSSSDVIFLENVLIMGGLVVRAALYCIAEKGRRHSKKLLTAAGRTCANVSPTWRET